MLTPAIASVRLRYVAVSLVLLSTAGSACAADLPVSLVSVSSPVTPFSDAAVEIHTTSGADCSITVLYKSGPSHAKGLYPQVANGEGRVAWEWRVGSRTTPGRWPIVVTCAKDGDQGSLKTSFEVR